MSLDHCFKGTWEHKLRQAEIERTAGVRWHENDQQAVDDDPPISHHISHFLPPEEMAKFMQRQKVWIVQTILNTVLPIFGMFEVPPSHDALGSVPPQILWYIGSCFAKGLNLVMVLQI